MNREQMVEQAAAALGAARCVVGCTVEQHTRVGAQAVFDAILPQITTEAQLKALPLWSTLVAETLGSRAWVFRWNGFGLYDPETDSTHPITWLVDRYGPLTVVWTPEVTA